MPLAWGLAVLQLAPTQQAQEIHMVVIPFLHVIFESQSWLELTAAALYLTANLKSRVKKGTMTDEKFTKTLQLVKPTLEYKDFNGVDAVIEVISLHPLHDRATAYQKSLVRFPSEHSMTLA
jgi:hypothetical protein